MACSNNISLGEGAEPLYSNHEIGETRHVGVEAYNCDNDECSALIMSNGSSHESKRSRISVPELTRPSTSSSGLVLEESSVDEEYFCLSSSSFLLEKSMENLRYENKKLCKELEKMKKQYHKISEEFKVVLLRSSSLEREIEKSKLELEKLQRKYELQFTELHKSTTRDTRFFVNFTKSEISEATNNFESSRKIWEDDVSETYKGMLHRTDVAIKVPSRDFVHGRQGFQHEVHLLSKLRHPNIVMLIGVCSEMSTLIYEYLPNGNLDDRINCKDNTPPLSWQTRIRIATELCSVLIFMHCQQESIIHGDLKLSKVLLDINLSCKISDLGINLIFNEETRRFYRTNPNDTLDYMDPEFRSTGELTPESDVYSLGMILLCLLTGKSELGIIKIVRSALDHGIINEILDPLAGNWAFEVAKQLALLGLSCCEKRRVDRPNLKTNVWSKLQSMRINLYESSSSYNLGRDESDDCPSYFICPITKEVMKDPHIAADGFTYEAYAMRCWLESGHEKSPMTNLKLKNLTLEPNLTLRYAIQDWLQHRDS